MSEERPAPPPIDEAEIASLRSRVDALESLVESLQDSLYRQAVQQDQRSDELLRRIEPEVLARSLSADARRRGL